MKLSYQLKNSCFSIFILLVLSCNNTNNCNCEKENNLIIDKRNIDFILDNCLQINCKRLSFIRLSNFQVEELIKLIPKKNDVQYFSLFEIENFNNIPLLINSFNKLTHLKINNTDLKEFNFNLYSFNESLIDLDLSDNKLEYIDGDYHLLSDINISKNNFSKLPSSLLNLKRINVLDFSENKIKDIDTATIKWNKKVKIIDVHGNSIDSLTILKINKKTGARVLMAESSPDG